MLVGWPSFLGWVQADLARLLLERLPEICDAEGEEAPVPQLILGQFRWWVLAPCRLLPLCGCWPAMWVLDAGRLLGAGLSVWC